MIFIAGATGFVGGHLVNELLSSGQKIRCLVRSEKSASMLRTRGVDVVRGDITDASSLRGTIGPGDFVVHLVGIIEERGDSTFVRVHVEGTGNLVEEAKRSGAKFLFYQSALGADRNSWSGYLRTKAEAEGIVRASGIDSAIFRPSLIIGPWDGFTKKMMDLIKLSPVLPIPGRGESKFQPLYIADWIRCFKLVLQRPAEFVSTFDLGGPEHLSYRKIVESLCEASGRSKPLFTVPMELMKISAAVLGLFLPSPPVTVDQLRLLEQDNVCELDSVEKHFGFRPKTFQDALREFIS